MNKPKDMLEFLRRSSEETQPPAAEPLAATPRVVVVRRSRLVLGAAGTAVGLILAFLLGILVGGGGGGSGAAFIKAAEFRNDPDGLRVANSVRTQLEQLNLGEGVSLIAVPGEETVAVALGPVEGPESRASRALLEQIRAIPDRRTNKTPFAEATFWYVKR